MKIIFILASVSQPRCIKRIRGFIEKGYNIEIYGFDRGVYNNKNNDVKINILGKQKDAQDYITKLYQSQLILRKLIKKFKNENVIFYSFGFVNTFILKINGIKKYIYEISDILYSNKRYNLIRWLIRYIDFLLIKKSLLTILTSEGFKYYIIKNKKYPNNVLIQPNKMASSFNLINRPKVKDIKIKEIVFGFVGAFRYPNTVFRFAKIVGEFYPNHSFYFFGDSFLTEQVIKLSQKYNNIKYFGPFKNPDDLNKIYGKIDLVVACYDIKGVGERIAEPNKLYEALFYIKPIIVSKNTYVEEKVNKIKCGFSLDASIDGNIKDFIDSLNITVIDQIRNNIAKLNLNEIIDDNGEAIHKYIQIRIN